MEKKNPIKDLIKLYVTENYKKYLQENNIKMIEESEISNIIKKLYIEKKPNLKIWLKECLKKLQGEEYMGDLAFQNLILEIFADNNLNCKILENEILSYQKNNLR